MKNFAILGAGGREHALADSLQQDTDVDSIGIF